MTREGTPEPTTVTSTWIDNLAQILLNPWAPVANKSELRQSQLIAGSSLVVTLCLLGGLLLPGAEWLRAHLALLLVSVPSYLFSRSRFSGLAALVFTFGSVAYAYLSLNLGSSPDLETAILPLALIGLIFASMTLSPTSLAILSIMATVLTFSAPHYAAAAVSSNNLRLGGLVLAISAILYGLRLYRDHLEGIRLRQLQDETRSLQRDRLDLAQHLGIQVADLNECSEELALRSADLSSANLRLERQASQLSTISQVIESIASIRELRELLPRIATVISQHLGVYHVGIFLPDEAREYAVLSAAVGQGGQRMLARKFRLRIGQEGIVGTVVATGQRRNTPDVGMETDFLENPDLPDTKSELVLPLWGPGQTEVIGVLDVQSMESGSFRDEDVQLLDLLANQLGIAIENALQNESARHSLAEAEALQRQYLRTGWSRMAGEQKLVGYRFDITGASPLTMPVDWSNGGGGNKEGDDPASLVSTPIELRGEVLGELVVHAPSGKQWNQDELDLIRAVAERVALSAENARLFEETNRRAERERMVSEITSKIRSTNDPSEMIKKAVQELKHALGVSRVEVRPQTASGGSDVYEA